MAKRMSVRAARASFGDVLGQVYYGNEQVIVEKNGKPVAVLISPEQWQRYRDLTKQRFFEAVNVLQELNSAQDPEEAERAIDDAVEEVRRERYGQERG